jgi:serine protease AprX
MSVRRSKSVAIALLAALVSSVVPATLAPASAAGSYDPATDAHSMWRLDQTLGATAWWDAGYTGAGVDVAIIDSGVSPVAGLDAPGKVIHGPDLSFESQAPNLTHLDTYGHGTFMAGVIAGRDAALTQPYSAAPATAYRGVAPDARIVSLKVATADGGTDVTQVIAAIDWVVQHKNDNGMNIRVLNLSYGTNSTQDSAIDPLSHAVEQAWKAGIVVVVAAGNAGYVKGKNAPGLANPARNPYVIAVGGVDNKGTSKVDDDVMGDYSSSGIDKKRSPDFVAPGSHVQGLRVPNSYIDANHPEGRLDDRYFRGSGTSQAAAVTSGVAALLVQRFPQITPDQVKQFLVDNAKGFGRTQSVRCGKGAIQIAGMVGKSLPRSKAQSFKAATGVGSVDASRGTERVSASGVTISGEIDIFGRPFDAVASAALRAARGSWNGGVWNGSSWSGSSWSGSSWSGSSWSGSSWSGSSWSGSSWSGSSWSGSSWSGSSWSGSSWSGAGWYGNVWATSSWT